MQATETDTNMTNLMTDVKDAIRNDLANRYDEPEIKSFLLQASVLDPRFRGLPFLSKAEHEIIYQELLENTLAYVEQLVPADYVQVILFKQNT